MKTVEERIIDKVEAEVIKRGAVGTEVVEISLPINQDEINQISKSLNLKSNYLYEIEEDQFGVKRLYVSYAEER